MPRINLLPVKAARRRDTARHEMFAMIGLVLMCMVGLYFWYFSLDNEVEELRSRIGRLNAEIAGLEKDVGKVKDFEAKEGKIRSKLVAIAQLKANKVGPSKMLNVLATILTEETKRVWLTKFSSSSNNLTLTGGAMEHEDISEFQLALERSPLFRNVKLRRVSRGQQEQIEYLSWELRCTTHFGSG